MGTFIIKTIILKVERESSTNLWVSNGRKKLTIPKLWVESFTSKTVTFTTAKNAMMVLKMIG